MLCLNSETISLYNSSLRKYLFIFKKTIALVVKRQISREMYNDDLFISFRYSSDKLESENASVHVWVRNSCLLHSPNVIHYHKTCAYFHTKTNLVLSVYCQLNKLTSYTAIYFCTHISICRLLKICSFNFKRAF